MTYYVDYKPLISKEPLHILNEQEEVVGSITFPSRKHDDITAQLNNTIYIIENNRLRRQSRYVIKDTSGTNLANIRAGVKIIHSIIEHGQYYFVKSAIWKLNYRLFDDRTPIGDLQMVRLHKKRYYRITLKEEDDIFTLSLFFLAHAVRLKAIIST